MPWTSERGQKLLVSVLVLSALSSLAGLASYASDRGDENRAEQVRAKLLENTNATVQQGKEIKKLTERIQSCTTPEGECAKRNQAGGVNLSAAITYCNLNLPKYAVRDVVTKCIVDELTATVGGG